jgi:Zn ribbon nucleic-acid-binding protein
MAQLTDKQYVDAGGGECPYCASLDLDAGVMENDYTTAWQKVKCLKCGKVWGDIYSLVGYEELEDY